MKLLRILSLALFLIVLSVGSVYGQALPTDRDFNIQTFHTAPGRDNFLTLEGARVDEHLDYSLGFMFNYQYKPLCFLTDTETYCLIKNHITTEVLVSFSIYEIFEMGFSLPIVMYQAGEDALVGGAVIANKVAVAGGLSDPRLHLKLDLLNALKNRFDNFGLALITVLSFPIGNAINNDQFIGDSNVTVHPKLAFEASVWRFRFGLNVGYIWRENKQFWQAERGHRISFGAAVEMDFHKDIVGFIELMGENAFSDKVYNNQLELHGGAKFQVYEGLWMTLGVGGGPQLGSDDETSLSRSIGPPLVRVLAGLKWEPPKEKAPEDKDKDGIIDEKDRCPNKPEDMDGFRDYDGCPEMDNDRDGLPDTKDKCPDDAEDEDGFEDRDGCPDTDNDEDGLADSIDECPDEAGPDSNKGCPFRDRDGDGISDDEDLCPDDPEVFNNVNDKDGCPDEALIEVTEEKIELKQKVFFDTGKATILDSSFEMLDQIVDFLTTKWQLKVRIEGHTDNRGSKRLNNKLSQKRAEAVKGYLVYKGIAEDRLEAIGFGPDQPIASNRTRQGRGDNRRVEFVILAAEKEEEAPAEDAPAADAPAKSE